MTPLPTADYQPPAVWTLAAMYSPLALILLPVAGAMAIIWIRQVRPHARLRAANRRRRRTAQARAEAACQVGDDTLAMLRQPARRRCDECDDPMCMGDHTFVSDGLSGELQRILREEGERRG